MTEREIVQARLADTYWTALELDPEAAPPQELNEEVARTIRRLVRGFAAAGPDPDFASRLRRTIQAEAASAASRRRAERPTVRRGWFSAGGAPMRLAALAAGLLVLVAGGLFASGVAASALEAPSVERFGPTASKDVPANAPVSITFDRPMLAPLAERALRIEPAVEGSISWKGNTMLFTPRTGWARGTRYNVSLDQSARGLLLLPLKTAVSYEFMTAEELAVLTVQPADGATEVATSNAIVVQFNYPIVPLGAAARGPNPLVIEPALPGKGKWVTTSLYMFQPDGGLAPGAKYRVTVPGGLRDTGGGTLAEDYAWSFTTKAPSVSTVTPEANTRSAGPRQEVRVTFDHPVDHASAESYFSLKSPSGEVVPGAISWDGEVLVFRPSGTLALETVYTASIAEGVAAARGGGMANPFSWSFTTVGRPRVESTVPAPGGQLPPYDSIRIRFSNPMDRDSVEKAISITPEPPQRPRIGWQQADSEAFVFGALKPSTTYTLAIGANATDRYGQGLGAPVEVRFTTAPVPPRANALIPGYVGTFNAVGEPRLFVEHLNVAELDLSLYRLDQQTFVRLAWDGKARRDFSPPANTLVRRWSAKTTPTERNEAGLTSIPLSASADKKLPAGFYYLRMQGPGTQASEHVFIVSRLSLTMKRSQDQMLVWATDLVSGNVVPDLPIRVTDRDGKTLATGRTDKDGLWLGSGIRRPSPGAGFEPLFAFSDAEGDAGVVGSDWADGIRPYEFDIPYDSMAQPYRGYVYTDRPIYRPGQKVNFKGFIRADDDALYTVPTGVSEVSVEVRDSQGRAVYSGAARLSDVGTFSGEVPLSTDAPLGYYNVVARVKNAYPADGTPTAKGGADWAVSVGFSVAEYRKPEFEVDLSAGAKSYVHGDQIPISGSAAYYFGQPVANATVKWRVISRNHIFTRNDGYQFIDSDLLADLRGVDERKRTEGQTTTDAQGAFSFTVPADLTQDPMSQAFTIEATIMDANNQEVSARTETVVHKGAVYVGLKPERYVVRTGDAAAVDVLAADTDGKPVPGAQVTVSFFARKWNSVKERQPDGGYLWISKPEDTLISSSQVTTDGSGKARATVAPKESGSLRVTAEVSDPRANRTRSATNLYVSGSGLAAWRMESTSRIDLVPDRKEYSVGETAKVLIPSPIPDALALVTVERGRVLTRQVMRLKGNSETIEVPVLAEHVPNVFVSVVLFKGSGPSGVATFRIGYGELRVSAAGKALQVSLTTDKPRYQPGENATYTIRTADSTGKGVPAEVSLAVIDASVLTLADDSTADPMDVFWGRRSLGTSTSATLSQSIDRFNADISLQRKGAGGGGDEPTVRREFPDTAYWNPSIRTNEKGEATVTLDVPDSLTTWKASAVAVTASTQFGTAAAEITVSKSLLLRPAFPRFLLMGDSLKLAAFLNNYTDSEVEADVSLAAKGVRLESGGGFATRRVRVAPGGSEKVEWPVKVDAVAGSGARATLRLDARPVTGGAPGDSVEIELPVKALNTAEVVATSGEVRDSTTELVHLPDGIDPAIGELTLETSPSLAAGMRYSARYLEEFPWECIEQTVSRFLPRVVMQRAFEKLNLPDKHGVSAGLQTTVPRNIQSLYAAQRPDGGWGWWPGDPSDQWITAYAVHGLAEASRSGHTVDQRVMDRATQFLRRSLDAASDVAHPENLNGRAYVLYVLALAGKGDVGLTNSLYDRRSALGNYGKAYLLLAMNSLGSGEADGKVKSLVSDLSSSAIVSATGAHWEEAAPDFRTMNTTTRTTASVLDALVRTAPDSQWIQPAVRWLMVARKEGHWETTQETAWSLLALTDYLEVSGELAADFAYRVTVNGKEAMLETVTPENVDEARTLVVQVKDLLQDADNRINIARAVPGQEQSGDGRLYYTASLRYFLPGDQVDAVSKGIGIVREYYRLGDEAAGPVTQVKPGDTVKVKLILVAMQDLHYLIVEDPLPSGLEAVDTRLKTTSMLAAAETGGVRVDDPSYNPKMPGGQPVRLSQWWKYDYFGHVEPRDDRVALFANFLPRGTYEYTYLARATSEGEFQALPAHGNEMYFPEVQGRSFGGRLTVAP